MKMLASYILNSNKVDVPNSITYLKHTPISEWYVVKRGSKNAYQNNAYLNEIKLTCSKYDNYSKLNSQHNRGGNLYDH